MMELLEDVLIRCSECGSVIEIHKEEIEFDAFTYDHGENGMGDEIEYRYDGVIVCEECGNEIQFRKEIREYIQAMIDSGNEDITPEWIEWALKKADWYDPSIETEDEYLGKRQHEKSAEEKEKSLQDSIRKSWYW